MLPNSSAGATEQYSQDDYADATRYCDIVMRGGITSGIVYPGAISELAKTYTFKRIGGTSAGAIAAAGTAAAELGRRRGTTSFSELQSLPKWLSDTDENGRLTNLFRLLQPSGATKPLFDILTAGMLEPNRPKLAIVLAALKALPLAAFLGALPGLILVVLALLSGYGLLSLWSVLMGVLLLVIGAAGAVVSRLARRAILALPDNFYGICSGFAEPRPSTSVPLTTWLADVLDRLAGRQGDDPLTFGDLWGTHEPEAEHDIELQLITTNLTVGRPYRLPFETREFYFDPKEFRRLFPDRVVRWMEQHQRTPSDPVHPRDIGDLCRLPEAWDLPFVVATRMSLSFPILISAVPLYAIDFSRRLERDRKPERCWFSDGGITSNFPVHFFDAPVPRWPTFAINLRPFHPDHPEDDDESKNVWMVESNKGGISAWWSRIDEKAGADRLLGFAHLILDTMQNWWDSSLLPIPGYRDRIVHIGLTENEGGMNLTMPPKRIGKLNERGRQAGLKLVRRFSVPPDPSEPLSWDDHRWVRYRSTMAALKKMMKAFYVGYTEHSPDDASYSELIKRGPDDPPAGYPLKIPSQRTFAAETTERVVEVAQDWSSRSDSFSEGDVPAPEPQLRLVPRL